MIYPPPLGPYLLGNWCGRSTDCLCLASPRAFGGGDALVEEEVPTTDPLFPESRMAKGRRVKSDE